MKAAQSKKKDRCSFCGNPPPPKSKLIEGSGVYICYDCVNLCKEIVDENSNPQKKQEERARQKASAIEDLKPFLSPDATIYSIAEAPAILVIKNGEICNISHFVLKAVELEKDNSFSVTRLSKDLFDDPSKLKHRRI
jgi:ClpX C4-type zinc finger